MRQNARAIRVEEGARCLWQERDTHRAPRMGLGRVIQFASWWWRREESIRAQKGEEASGKGLQKEINNTEERATSSPYHNLSPTEAARRPAPRRIGCQLAATLPPPRRSPSLKPATSPTLPYSTNICNNLMLISVLVTATKKSSSASQEKNKGIWQLGMSEAIKD